jgi:hypothetical protein
MLPAPTVSVPSPAVASGDVRLPQSIGSISVDLPIDEVDRTRGLRIGPHRDDVPPRRGTTQSCQLRQAGHPLEAQENAVATVNGFDVRR